ncbi:hypothetical protein [Aeromonas veronii]|uniref:hypothetical protein n=1 Tax=Aeromonas veronii TaxID=654 RepID=UPI00111AAD52|nr:hypothetical protein [Aeromonas veronii]TNI12713.1 hypothetical protein CF106_08405 [Aeromonas veronii]
MAVLSFKSYGFSAEPIYVMSERITHFYGVNYNGNPGTMLVLDTGNEVTVGEWSLDVKRKLDEAHKE